MVTWFTIARMSTALVYEIVNQTGDMIFDLTGEGVVNQGDLIFWLANAGAHELPSGNPFPLGDANLDGVVDGVDFIKWNDNKFNSNPAWCAGDFNADGLVNGGDFIVWNDHKFTSALDGARGMLPVPEPSGLWLALLALGLWRTAAA